MEKFLKEIRQSVVIYGCLSVVLGVVLVLYPQLSTKIICTAFGAILVLCAVFHMISYLRHKDEAPFINFNLIAAVITGVIGIWIIVKPEMVVLIIPVIFGIVLVIHGISDLRQAIELKKRFYDYWWAALIIAVLNVLIGAVLLTDPFRAAVVSIRVIGICLIYDGVSDLWIVSRVSKAVKDIEASLENINIVNDDDEI